MAFKLLTEHHLDLSLKEATQARLSLHLSKCHIDGNHMSRFICKQHTVWAQSCGVVFSINGIRPNTL